MTTRRTFLGTAVAAAAVADAGTRPAAAAPGGSPYDFPAIDAALAKPARHRQVFAVAKTQNGNIAGYLRHSMDAYEVAMGEGPGALHPAAVFYGTGVVLGLNDDAWRRYRIAEALHRRGDVLTAQGEGNPFAADLHALAGRGATYFVCDNAVADWATYLTAVMGASDKSPDQVRADLRASLIPGALLVPAGVAALNHAQEARFTYVQASL